MTTTTQKGPIYQMVEEQAKKYDIDSRTFKLVGDFTLASRVLGLATCLEQLLPKIQELEPVWISVEEKLPEKQYSIYLVTDGNKTWTQSFFCWSTPSYGDNFRSHEVNHNITHWQPLPLPPK